ncbi:aquaporin-8a.1 [Halichoeres trimaculatus]|uniref:aquaporin-8a.1 n=1 Tax=Halichoeres trimaculatus TaxID=147232 RepID=UPI003D9F6F00
MSGEETKSEVFTITEEVEVRQTSKKRCMFEKYVQPCLAELFGTGLFVFVGCASVVGNAEAGGVIQPAVAHGLALGVLIMVFGQISGGHFNPAVSLMAYLCGGMELHLLLPYIMAQMLGGMAGAGLTKAIYPDSAYAASLGGSFAAAPEALAETTLAEVIMTTFLTTVVCMGAINTKTSSPWAPLCIGLTVTANICAGAVISGACMNPARAFGPAVVANHWDHHWIYWVGPLCGALVTVSFIRLLLGDQKTRLVLK